MKNRAIVSLCVATVLPALPGVAHAQATQYGPNVSHEQARSAVGSSIAEARRQNLPMAVAVVDNAGQLVAFERMDNTLTASVAVAQDKAVSAAIWRRPTKVFQDVLAGGGVGLRVLNLRGATAVEGGLPLVVDGKVVGGIGVSGGSAEQDGAVAKVGADVIGK